MSRELTQLVRCIVGRIAEPDDGWLDTAVALACDVRDDTARARRSIVALDELELRGLVVALAALVPLDRPVAQLSGWMREPVRRNQHLGVARTRSWTEQQLREAHSRYNSAAKRARARGVELSVDELTREGEREYNRRRKSGAA